MPLCQVLCGVNFLEISNGRAGSEYVSLSWSWASISWTEAKNKVPKPQFKGNYDQARQHLLQRINQGSFSAKVEVSGKNPYGRIRSGVLVVSGFFEAGTTSMVSTQTGRDFEGLSAKVLPVPLKYNLEINGKDPLPAEAPDPVIERPNAHGSP